MLKNVGWLINDQGFTSVFLLLTLALGFIAFWFLAEEESTTSILVDPKRQIPGISAFFAFTMGASISGVLFTLFVNCKLECGGIYLLLSSLIFAIPFYFFAKKRLIRAKKTVNKYVPVRFGI